MTDLGSNPAIRLESELRILMVAAANEEARVLVRDLWKKGSGITAEDHLARHIAMLMRLADEVRTRISVLEPDYAHVVTPVLSQVERAMLHAPTGRWENFWPTLGGDAALRELTLMGRLIDRGDSVKLRIENVDQLRDRLTEILTVVLSDSPGLDEAQRNDLARRLMEMIDSLSEAHGTTGWFSNVAGALLGKVIGDPELANRLSGSRGGVAVLSLLAALMTAGQFGLLPALGQGEDLPTPDPVVVECVFSEGVELPALPAGAPQPPALGAGDPESDDDPGADSEGG